MTPLGADLAAHIVEVPDFPKPGILFRDIMPLLRTRFGDTIAALSAQFDAATWDAIDIVAGIESRGFVLAAALADRHGKGFVPVRKHGKLPPPVVAVSYALEYGTDILEMQAGSGRVLLVDDVLATGGTMRASVDLCTRAGYHVRHLLVLTDLRIVTDFRCGELAVQSVVQYGAS